MDSPSRDAKEKWNHEPPHPTKTAIGNVSHTPTTEVIENSTYLLVYISFVRLLILLSIARSTSSACLTNPSEFHATTRSSSSFESNRRRKAA